MKPAPGRMVLLLAAILSAWGAGAVSAQQPVNASYFRQVEADAAQRYDEFEKRYREFIQLVEQSLALRRDAIELFTKLHEKLGGESHLTAANQRALQENLERYRHNSAELEVFLEAYAAYSSAEVNIEFPTGEPSSSETIESLFGSGETALRINPTDDFGRLMVLEIKMWLAAKLMQFDNYVVVLVRYLKNSELRRQFDLENVDAEGKRFLVTMTEEISDPDKYRRTVRMVRLVQAIQEYQRSHPTSKIARDKDDAYLDALIKGSYAYRRIPELTVGDRDEIVSAIKRNEFHDDVIGLTDDATYELSKFFGNAIGLYEERKGKLYGMSGEAQQQITATLRPLDILFEKTPFRLTDLFIPGHWGHVAIWVGDRDTIPELERLGVWQELPRLESEARERFGYAGPSFRALIESDHGVLEALRSGVELNTFARFLNIDDLAVVRPGGLSDTQKRTYLLAAFAQVGKAYDFNFDVETNHTIVCSELAYVVFHDVDWPVEESVGRYTVSPDHIATLARSEGDPFTPVLIYHDGRALPAEHLHRNLDALLREDYDRVIWQ
ncbi:MAG: hypothetical protein GWP66_08940 [Gammaproteobacteria bacterium]|nr:hypothetical protein [Gammaproteobacteria bacterium]